MTDAAGISRILTLVFTDLAGSTALKTQRGDQAVGELITRHRAPVRRLAAESGGRIVDWAGDGCFLTFETPSAAVLFALRLQQVHREEPDLPGVHLVSQSSRQRRRGGPTPERHHRSHPDGRVTKVARREIGSATKLTRSAAGATSRIGAAGLRPVASPPRHRHNRCTRRSV